MKAALIEQSVDTFAALESYQPPLPPALSGRRIIKGMLHAILPVLLSSVTLAEVGTTVYPSEPNMVLEPISDANGVITYAEIMVGTKLAIVVDSNQYGRWHGGIFIEGPSLGYGFLTARDYNDVALDWEGSHYPEAGISRALVLDESDILREGFGLYADGSAVPGDWFVIDYVAAKPGPCTVYLCYYDYEYPWPPDPPTPPEEFLIEELAFYNVATRDFDGNGAVGLSDCALLADCWIQPVLNGDSPCSQVDFNADAWVDFADLAIFAHFWLERTEY